MLMTSTVGAEQQLQGMLEDPAPYLVIEREYFCQSPVHISIVHSRHFDRCVGEK